MILNSISAILAAAFILIPTNTAFAAGLCNRDASAPISCKSDDGKFEIHIHDRFFWDDISTSAFCNEGYIKIRDVELNGPADGPPPENAGLEMVQSLTSTHGLTTTVPDPAILNSTEGKAVVRTAVYMQFSTTGMNLLNDDHLSYGKVLVELDQRSAAMFLIDNANRISSTKLSCE